MREAGFVSCLTKPVRHSQLFDAVMDAIAGPGARRDASAGAAGAEAGAVRGSRWSARVLLAEDNEINQEVARELLAEAGCEVVVVGNGEQAVRAVGSAEFDVVLMDCQMPVMDGWEATRQIRKLEGGGAARTPIVALTASAVEGDRQRCLEAGMDDYVTKPIDPEMLLEAIRRFRRSGAAGGEGGGVAVVASSPAVAEGVAPAGDAVDVPSLLRRCQGKASLAERLLVKFENQLPGQLAELRELLGAGDRAALGRLAHTIKGTAANLSVERLRSAAASLEAAAGAADAAAGLDEQLRQLSRAAEECLGGLPGAVERLRSAGVSAGGV
jgi:CheY-like chemotaxis protein/HPt (histidine-containing phosphotransfer) domain-containing protein